MSSDRSNVNSISNILIVDDEENARIGLSKLLADEGYKVSSAGDGIEALSVLQGDQYQLVITDIDMPRMNGISFLSELNQQYPRLSVLMMTALGTVEPYMEAMNLGVYEYLHKPIKLDDLKSVMLKLSRETGH